MKLSVAFTRLAQTELNEAIVYIGERDPKAAVALVSRIRSRIDLLRDQPEMGRRGQVRGTRELVVDGTRYLIVYRIGTASKPHFERRIEVLRVLHTARGSQR